MNKLIKTLIPLALLGTTMAGCSMYQSKAAPKEDFVGTYELDIYKSRHEMNSEEEPYDRKAEEGIQAYFSLDADGHGYYGYKDNNTEARVTSVFSKYLTDEDQPELFKAIEMDDGVTHKYEWEWKVGCLDEPTMGFMTKEKEIEEKGFLGITFKKKVKEYTLSYTIPQRHNNVMNKDIHYQYVCYKKVSNEVGLDPVNRLLGTSFTFDKPFELKQAWGYYVYRCQTKEGSGIGDKNIYEYAILNMSTYANGKAYLYYSTVANPGKQTVEVSFAVETPGSTMSATILGSTFHSRSLGIAFETDFNNESEIQQERFIKVNDDGLLTLNDIIAQETQVPEE